MANQPPPDEFVQRKLFGPFHGLNNPKSPFLRSLPPNPYMRPEEYATECKNLIIDQHYNDLISRNGIELVEKGSAATDNSTYVATSGLFKWVDYDSYTGKPTERAVQLSITQAGVPTVTIYTRILTELRSTSNTLDGKTFAIIEDPDNSYAKRFMIYNSNGTVANAYTTLAGVTNTSTSYKNWDTNVDGPIVVGAVDLVQPTTLTYSASGDMIATQVVQFWSLAKRTITESNINLSSWISTLNTDSAVFFTGAQASNILFISNGTNAVLKYDGQSLYKAGMPNAGLNGYVTSLPITYASWTGASLVGVLDGLIMGDGLVADVVGNLGKFVYMHSYERGDAKNNYIEGEAFMHGTPAPTDRFGAPTITTLETVTPNYIPLYDIIYTAPSTVDTANSYLNQYKAPSLVASNQFDARACQIAVDQHIVGQTNGDPSTAPTTDFTITVGSGLNTLRVNDIICFRAILNNSAGSDAHTPVLITCRLKSFTATTITIDYHYPINVEIIPGGHYKSNALDGILNDVTNDSLQAIISALESLTTWQELFAWNWLGYMGIVGAFLDIWIPKEFVISNNLRINVYRNKANVNEGNAYNPFDINGQYIPDMFLLNVLPNDPFHSTTSMGLEFDNCKDASLGAQYIAKFPLLVENKRDATTLDADYSPLPKGKGISSFKGRIYLTDDLSNVNILWRSSTLYGTEWFDPSDTLSMETQKGDTAKIAVGNENIVFVLKDEGIKVIINDLSNENIRVDDLVVGKYGCIAPRSAQPLKKGVAYLSASGPVIVTIEDDPQYLGQNSNNISKIRDRMDNSRYDLKRATAWVIPERNWYVLYIPEFSRASSGLFNPNDFLHTDYVDQGTTFVYDYANDAWTEWSGVNAKGGLLDLNERLFFLAAGAHNKTDGTSGLEWAFYKERDYGNLWSFADYVDVSGTPTLRGITHLYDTDWLGMDDPDIFKKFLRCKVASLHQFTDLSVKGSSGTTSAATGAFTLTVKTYKDFRTDVVQSSSTMTLGSGVQYGLTKMRNNKSTVMRFELSHSTVYSSPRIQALVIEAAAAYKTHLKPWSTP